MNGKPNETSPFVPRWTNLVFIFSLVFVVVCPYPFFVDAASTSLRSPKNERKAAGRGLATANVGSTTPVASSRHAYAFLLAGCDPKESTYMGGVYGVLVANDMIRQSGSTNDVVLMVRMATATEAEVLPHDVEQLIKKAGIIIKYIPKVKTDNFYTAIMEKFRILSWVEYSRVLFLDTDAMPLCNLDYLFDMSEGENAVLRENLILATRNAPADAGFFMLKPDKADYLEMREIVRNRERHGKLDVEKGWGHAITPPDKWVAKYEEGTLWDYYGSIADQGLLYHWTKYVKKSVTIVINDLVENWGVMPNRENGEAVMIDSSRVILGDGCANRRQVIDIPEECKGHYPPAKDYVHFCANDKPWFQGGPPAPVNDVSKRTPYHVWFNTLNDIFKRYDYKVDVSELYLWPEFGFALKEEQAIEQVKHRFTT